MALTLCAGDCRSIAWCYPVDMVTPCVVEVNVGLLQAMVLLLSIYLFIEMLCNMASAGL